MGKEPDVEALWISHCAEVEAPRCSQMLLLGKRTDGSTYSFDTGLTVDEAKELASLFITWVNECLKASEEERDRK